MSALTQQELLATTSIDTSEESFQERQFYNAKRLPVEIYKNSYALPQIALSSALFGVAGATVKVDGKFVQRQRQVFTRKHIAAYGGGEIVYSGEELRQDDKRVFMALLHAVRSRPLNAVISFVPREFVRTMGWSDSKNSIDNLMESIKRLQDATLEVALEDGRKGLRAKMVGVFDYRADTWSVELSDSVREMFVGSSTYLSIDDYRRVRDGLQTWLWAFLKAQYTESAFDIADLHKYSGSEATLENFSASVREAAAKLVAAGVFERLTFGYGRLRVGKK